MLKRDKQLKDAHELYTKAGETIVKHYTDPIYGKNMKENHPLMQQFYLLEKEWAEACKLEDI